MELPVSKEACLMKAHPCYWFRWEGKRTRSVSSSALLGLEELFIGGGMCSELVQPLFFINEFTPCGREAIPYALFTLTADLEAGIKYYADFYQAVSYGLRGWGLPSPESFLFFQYILLLLVYWYFWFCLDLALPFSTPPPKKKVTIKRKNKPSLHPQPKPERMQTVCDSWLLVAGRKYLIHFPVWAVVNLKGTLSINLTFPQSVAQPIKESVFLVWCTPTSRKENAAEAVPAGSKPKFHFQSQGNGISRVGTKVEAKQRQHLGCSLGATAVWERREGGERKKGMPN